MTVTVVDLDAFGQLTAAPAAVRSGSLSSVLKRAGVALDRPVIVSRLTRKDVERLGTFSGDDARPTLDRRVRLRKEFKTTRARRGDVVVVRAIVGQGGGGGGNQGKQIGAALASIALLVAAPWAAGTLAPLLFAGAAPAWAVPALSGLIIAGGTAAINRLLVPQARRNTDASRPTYGVSGGGNVPRPQDHIPVLYGRCWHSFDLSQPDYVEWDGDTQILYKRGTIGLGQYELLKVRAGSTTLWESGAVTASFPGAAVELIQPGTASTLVPLSVVTAQDVSGQQLPGTFGSPTYVGPFVVNAAETTVTQLVVDISFPGGGLRVDNKGRTFPVTATLIAEYRQINDAGSPIGSWTTIATPSYTLSSAATARYSIRATVPAGRYEVRVARTNAQFGTQGDQPQWDQLRGIRPDPAIRAGVTEIALRVRATAGQAVTSFSDVMVQAQRLLPVWSSGSGWSAPQATRSPIWAALDVLRNTDYGVGIPDAKIDLVRFAYYAGVATSRGDTFDCVIRGPTSALEAMETILRPMRSQPLWIGRQWTIVRDEAATAFRHVFTAREMVKGTCRVQTTIATEEGAGDIILEYDKDADPKQKREIRVSARVGGALTVKPTRVRIDGIDNYEQGWREAIYLANAGLLRNQIISFDASLSHRLIKRGDAAIVEVPFLEAAQIRGVIASGGTGGRTLTLNADVEVGSQFEALFRRRDGRAWGPVKVTQGATAREIVLDATDVAAAATATGIALASAVIPDNGGSITSVRIGALTVVPEYVRIVSVKPKSGRLGTVTAVTDPTSIHTADGSTAPSEFVPPSRDGIPATIDLQGLVANAVTNGAVVEMTWSVRPSLGAVRYLVQIAYTGSGVRETIYDGTETSGRTTIRPTNLTVYARAFGASGQASPERSYAVVPPVPTVVADEVVPSLIDFGDLREEARRILAGDEEFNRLIEQVSASVARLQSTVIPQIERSLQSEGADRRAQYQEIISTAQGDFGAIVTRLQTLEASVGSSTATGSILARLATAETTVASLENDDGTAVAQVRRVLEVVREEVGRVQASLTDIATAVASEVRAGVQLSQSVSASLGEARAEYTRRLDVAVAANEARVAEISALTATLNSAIGTLNASITAANEARAAGDAANAASITSLDSRLTSAEGVNAGQATAISGLNTRVTAAEGVNTAQASALDVLRAVLGGNTAEVQVQIAAVSAASGAAASYAIQVRAATGGAWRTAALRIDALSAGGTRIVIQGDKIVFDSASLQLKHSTVNSGNPVDFVTATGGRFLLNSNLIADLPNLAASVRSNSVTGTTSATITSRGGRLRIECIVRDTGTWINSTFNGASVQCQFQRQPSGGSITNFGPLIDVHAAMTSFVVDINGVATGGWTRESFLTIEDTPAAGTYNYTIMGATAVFFRATETVI